jgi:hypothetical protein
LSGAANAEGTADSAVTRSDAIDPEIAAQIQQMHIHNLDAPPATAAASDAPALASAHSDPVAPTDSLGPSDATATTRSSPPAPSSAGDDAERIPFMPSAQEIAIMKAASASRPMDGAVVEPDRPVRPDDSGKSAAAAPAPPRAAAAAPAGAAPRPLDAVDVAILALLALLAVCIVGTIIHIASSEPGPSDDSDQKEL